MADIVERITIWLETSYQPDPPNDALLMIDARREIERLRQKEEDILAGIQLVVKGSNAGRDQEIERLNTKIENLQAHIQWLTQVAQERIHG